MSTENRARGPLQRMIISRVAVQGGQSTPALTADLAELGYGANSTRRAIRALADRGLIFKEDGIWHLGDFSPRRPAP